MISSCCHLPLSTTERYHCVAVFHYRQKLTILYIMLCFNYPKHRKLSCSDYQILKALVPHYISDISTAQGPSRCSLPISKTAPCLCGQSTLIQLRSTSTPPPPFSRSPTPTPIPAKEMENTWGEGRIQGEGAPGGVGGGGGGRDEHQTPRQTQRRNDRDGRVNCSISDT